LTQGQQGFVVDPPCSLGCIKWAMSGSKNADVLPLPANSRKVQKKDGRKRCSQELCALTSLPLHGRWGAYKLFWGGEMLHADTFATHQWHCLPGLHRLKP
jgi:hypothetical protein